jgi:hypothetical protein
MHLSDWLEKAKGSHKYIRKYYVAGKAHYEYLTPGGQKVSVPSMGAVEAAKQEAEAPKKEPVKEPAKEKKEPTEPAPEKKAPKVEAPKVTPKQVREGKEKLNSKEENERMFGLASDVVRAAIPKSDRGATLKAARALLELAKQPGQKGKVLKQIRELAGEARKHAKTMNNRYNADRYKEKPPKGREPYTYDDVLAARSVRDLLDKARTKVQEIKTTKKAEKPTQEVEAKLQVPPEAKAEVKQEKAEAEKNRHKEPNFRDFGGQAFKFDIPGTTMTAEVTQNPDVRSLGRYEMLRMSVKDKAGEKVGHVDYSLESGEPYLDRATSEGDIPSKAMPLLNKHFQEGLAKREEANEKAKKEKERAATAAYQATQQVKEVAPPRPGMSIKLQGYRDKTVTLSLDDPMYGSESKLIEGTKGWWGDDHKRAAKLHREQAADLGGPEGKKHRHLANAHMSMAKWDTDRTKHPGTAAAASPWGVGSHLDLAERVKKSFGAGEWLQQKENGTDQTEQMEKAMDQDNKPGESLEETSTEELTQTKKDLAARLKSKMDPGEAKGLKARYDAISGELARRGNDSMDKCGPGMQKACGETHKGKDLQGWMKKAEDEEKENEDTGKEDGEDMAEKSMSLDQWMEKAMPSHEARMGGPKSDAQGASQDGGDWEGKGKTPDSNGGPVKAPGQDAQGKVTGSDPGKQEKLSEDDEEQGELGAPEKKKPIEKLGKSELYPAPLTPARQREMMAHDVAKLRKSQEMVTIGHHNHPYGYARTMGADHDALSKSEGSTDIPRLSVSPGQSLAQSHVLCKSVHPGGCDAQHSAMLTACPECGAGTTRHRIWPSSSEVRVIPTASPGGLRPAKRDPMVKIH